MVCLNCGEKLLGDYCWSCGQEARDLHRPLKQLVLDVVGDVFSFDTRFLRSVGPLLLKPGFLTREHIAGRRIRYIPPLRIYIFVTLLFFGFIATRPPRQMEVVEEGSAGVTQAPRGIYILKEDRPPGGARDRFRITLPKDLDISFGGRLKDAGAKAKHDPQKFGEAVLANLPRAFFLLLPAFALLLKLLYWRRDRFYLDHLVFALHYHSFAFLILVLLMLLGKDWVPDAIAWPLVLALWIWFFAYLAVALRKVYGGSWIATLLRFAGLLASYGLVFGFTLVGMALVTLWMFG